MPKRQDTIVLGCVRRGDSFPVCPQKAEHCLNELQRWVRAMVISADIRDRHETLTWLLQPPRSLCASTGHYPHLPSWEPVNPPVPGSRDPGTNSPGEHTGASDCCNVMPASATIGSPHISIITTVPLHPHGLNEQGTLNQPLL